MEYLLLFLLVAAALLLLRYAFKWPWGFSLAGALLVLAVLKMSLYKEALEAAGAALGTNTVLVIAAVLMLVLLFLNVPVFISVLCASMLYFIFNPGINEVIFGQRSILGTENNALLAIPFFVCSATFMNYSGVSDRIFDFCAVLTGRMRGGWRG